MGSISLSLSTSESVLLDITVLDKTHLAAECARKSIKNKKGALQEEFSGAAVTKSYACQVGESRVLLSNRFYIVVPI